MDDVGLEQRVGGLESQMSGELMGSPRGGNSILSHSCHLPVSLLFLLLVTCHYKGLWRSEQGDL